MRKVQ